MKIYPVIQKPCSKNWDSLSGDQKQRFCSECQHSVHHLDFLTESEQSKLLQSPGRHCVAYSDTSIIKIDIHKWNFLAYIRSISRLGYAVAAIIVTFFATGCAITSRKDTSACPPTIQEIQATSKDNDGKSFETVGIIIVERPLWKRILWPFE
jgi:hypothetical protein